VRGPGCVIVYAHGNDAFMSSRLLGLGVTHLTVLQKNPRPNQDYESNPVCGL
jgi:hypothetical protein